VIVCVPAKHLVCRSFNCLTGQVSRKRSRHCLRPTQWRVYCYHAGLRLLKTWHDETINRRFRSEDSRGLKLDTACIDVADRIAELVVLSSGIKPDDQHVLRTRTSDKEVLRCPRKDTHDAKLETADAEELSSAAAVSS